MQLISSAGQSSSGLNMSKINVKINAPNWPAMVKYEESKKSSEICESKFRLNPAASSLWLTSHYSRQKSRDMKAAPVTNFASKTSIVRQCPECQILYSSFHKCIPSERRFDETAQINGSTSDQNG